MFLPLPDIAVTPEPKDATQAAAAAKDKSERARLLAVKQALLVTASTTGWQYIKQIAANITNKAINESVDLDPGPKADMAKARAQAAKQIFRELFAVIETTMTFGTDDEPEWFSMLDEFTGSTGEENGKAQ